jgi:hypothetical protein
LPTFLSIPILAAVLAVPPTSHRTGASTFREDDNGLSVFADGYPASSRAKDAYVPVPVTIALVRNGASVAFTLESFTLTDAQGNSVPAVGFAEMRNSYPKLDFDRILTRTWPISVGMTIDNRPRMASSFYPPMNDGTMITRVELAPYSWFSDVIYFPQPPAGLGGVMTLSVAITGGDSINVRLLMSPEELAPR